MKQKKAIYVVGDEKVAKVSVVGVGMRTHSGVAATMFKILRYRGSKHSNDFDQ